MIHTLHISDFKAKFSEVVKLVENGITIKVIKGKAGEVVGYFSKKETKNPANYRTPGLLQNKKFELSNHFFSMTEEDLDQWGL